MVQNQFRVRPALAISNTRLHVHLTEQFFLVQVAIDFCHLFILDVITGPGRDLDDVARHDLVAMDCVVRGDFVLKICFHDEEDALPVDGNHKRYYRLVCGGMDWSVMPFDALGALDGANARIGDNEFDAVGIECVLFVVVLRVESSDVIEKLIAGEVRHGNAGQNERVKRDRRYLLFLVEGVNLDLLDLNYESMCEVDIPFFKSLHQQVFVGVYSLWACSLGT